MLAGQEKARLLGLDLTVDVSSLKFYYAEDDGGFPLGMTSERMPTFWAEFCLHFGKIKGHRIEVFVTIALSAMSLDHHYYYYCYPEVHL